MGSILRKEQRKTDTILTEQTIPTSGFQYADGRRFHNVEGLKYPLPNDDDELDRLHLQHFVIRHFFQSNFSAPIEHVLNSNGSKVLDVGCGAGSWMFDMATEYPTAEIIGIDVSPVQPSNIKPENVSFICANVLTGLPFEDNTFDYVFQRLMVGAIPSDNWPGVIRELTRVLKPGGYLEVSEMGLPQRLGPVTTKIVDAVGEMFAKRNLDIKLHHRLRSLVKQNGQYEDINEEKNALSYGAEFGKLSQAGIDNLKTGIGNLRHVTLPILGVTSEEYDEMLNIMAKETEDYNSYQEINRVYARKK